MTLSAVEQRPFAPLSVLLAVGFFLGILVSIGLLSGDAQGRVNVLLLLALFVGLPLVALAAYLTAYWRNAKPLTGIMLTMFMRRFPPLAPDAWLHWQQSPQFMPWLRLQSQYVAIAYAMGSVTGLLLLLLFSDVNFVWRSTLLTPEQLLPLLTTLAKPWWFWSSAQPSLAVLSATQDSRLLGGDTTSMHAHWWPFIVATQLCYVVMLRALMAMLSAWRLYQLGREHAPPAVLFETRTVPRVFELTSEKSEVSSHLPKAFVWVNWSGVDDAIWRQLGAPLTQMPCVVKGPMATEHEQQQAQGDVRPQVVLVKAWEPPLAELADYMRGVSTGWVVPIDVHQQRLSAPRQQHVDEWRRFVAKVPGWSLYLPKVTE